VLPENPGIFGLSALDPVDIPHPSGKINQSQSVFCGANVGPLLSAREIREGGAVHGARRKVISGQHSTSVDEVRAQVYWPHMLLDSVIQPSRPEYDALTPIQFAAGFSAFILMYMPQELDNSPWMNMLRHYNRLMSFAMASDWASVLAFNAQFLHSCENQQVSFRSWEAIKTWHDRHLDSVRLHGAAKKNPKKSGDGNGGAGGNNNNNNGGDDGDAKKKKGPNFVPESFLRSKHLCLKFQRGTCDEPENHQFGKVELVHACGLCLLKDRGLVTDHGFKSCPRKSKEKGF
jgi:hypothetical protein